VVGAVFLRLDNASITNSDSDSDSDSDRHLTLNNSGVCRNDYEKHFNLFYSIISCGVYQSGSQCRVRRKMILMMVIKTNDTIQYNTIMFEIKKTPHAK
jgi:hypothetical protein